jgi:diaminopropionate ammonia-lyase
MGGAIDSWTTLDDLADRLAPLRPLTLVTATDGNHGRAVARIAAQLGFAAQIFVPAGMAAARIRAIESEGAQITIVDGTYDEAVALAAAQASPHCLVISDTAWPGYELIPQHVIAGYSTIFWEIDDELERRGEPQPDLIAVQIGVGALAAAVVRHYRRDHRRTANDQRTVQEQSSPVGRRLSIVGVEPTRAACMLESIRAGRMIEVPGPHDSIMAGLNCGAPSPVAWPSVSNGVDLFVAIEDTRAEEAMRLLAQYGVVAGETGAAGLGGLLELLTGQQAAETRAALGITPDTRALLISTEGATDPDAYARIVGQPADTSVL